MLEIMAGFLLPWCVQIPSACAHTQAHVHESERFDWVQLEKEKDITGQRARYCDSYTFHSRSRLVLKEMLGNQSHSIDEQTEARET